ncbi:MAG TPA: hypothetical protein VF077_12915 [Nitrospiraceae bacterium]
MAYDNSDSDLYGGGETSAEPALDQSTDDSSDQQTATIPKSVLMGKEVAPGDKITMEVLKVMPEEVLVKCGPYDKEESGEGEGPTPTASDMAPMME